MPPRRSERQAAAASAVASPSARSPSESGSDLTTSTSNSTPLPPRQCAKAARKPEARPSAAPKQRNPIVTVDIPIGKRRRTLKPTIKGTGATSGPAESDGSSLADAQSSVERGGKAAMEVYKTLEIRQKILQLMDKSTLARMLRCHKLITASVAEVLYKVVHVSLMSRMSRATPRRTTYCNAVRILDLNPLPFSDNKKSKWYSWARFNPDSLLEDLPPWRTKYPQLHTIIRDRPISTCGDAYTVRLAGQQVTVDLETKHRITLHSFPDTPPSLPPSPSISGLTVRHTIALSMVGGYQHGAYHYTTGTYLPHTPIATLEHWRAWVLDPELDHRVTSLDLGGTLITLSEDEIIGFIFHRRQNCGPLREFHMPHLADASQLERVLAALAVGSDIQELHLRMSMMEAIDDWPKVIELLDQALPRLQKLVMSTTHQLDDPRTNAGRIPASVRLSGLSHLKVFVLDPGREDDCMALARSIYQLGMRGCSFYPAGMSCKAFNTLIDHLKSSSPRYALLHAVRSRDLDLWGTSSVSDYSFEPTDGVLRRVAWNTTSTYAAKLSESRGVFEDLVVRYRAADDSYEQLLTQTTGGLAAAGGDAKAEAKVLKEEFPKVEKEHGELMAVGQAIKSMIVGKEIKSRGMLSYSQSWLGHNQPKEKK